MDVTFLETKQTTFLSSVFIFLFLNCHVFVQQFFPKEKMFRSRVWFQTPQGFESVSLDWVSTNSSLCRMQICSIASVWLVSSVTLSPKEEIAEQ